VAKLNNKDWTGGGATTQPSHRREAKVPALSGKGPSGPKISESREKSANPRKEEEDLTVQVNERGKGLKESIRGKKMG